MEAKSEIIPAEPKPIPTSKFIAGSDIGEYRDALVEQYYSNGKHKSVLKKIKENDKDTTLDELLGLIVEEILDGGEDILGTQLMLSEQGDLINSTAAVMKRSELMKSVADIIAKRKELNQRASDIDLNSPAFMLFQKLCIDKLVRALEDLKLDSEMISLIISSWSSLMKDWGKELKQKLEEMAQ